MKKLLIASLLVSSSAFAKNTQILCGTAFYGPTLIMNEAGEVLKASFQNGYSSARLNCGAWSGSRITCSRPSVLDAGGNPLPSYKLKFDLDALTARSEVMYPGSRAPIVKNFQDCELH